MKARSPLETGAELFLFVVPPLASFVVGILTSVETAEPVFGIANGGGNAEMWLQVGSVPLALLGLIFSSALRVRHCVPTRFPRLFALAPKTALVGFVLGFTFFTIVQRDLARDHARRRLPSTSAYAPAPRVAPKKSAIAS